MLLEVEGGEMKAEEERSIRLTQLWLIQGQCRFKGNNQLTSTQEQNGGQRPKEGRESTAKAGAKTTQHPEN